MVSEHGKNGVTRCPNDDELANQHRAVAEADQLDELGHEQRGCRWVRGKRNDRIGRSRQMSREVQKLHNHRPMGEVIVLNEWTVK